MTEKSPENACSVNAITDEFSARVSEAKAAGAAIGAAAGGAVFDGINETAAFYHLPYRYQSGAEKDPIKAHADIENAGSMMASVLGHEVIDPYIAKMQSSLNPGVLVGAAWGGALGATKAAIIGTVAAIGTIHHCATGDGNTTPSASLKTAPARVR